MPTPPASFDELKSAIVAQFPQLSGQLQRIARFVLERPSEVAFTTVARLGESIGVQPSSLVRFAQAFGLAGFSDMQALFRARLAANSPSYLERVEILRRNVQDESGHSEAAVLNRFIGDGMASLDHLRTAVPIRQLQQAADVLARARSVYVLAQGRSFTVGYYLFYTLRRFDMRAELIDGLAGMDRERTRHAGPGDAVAAVSFRDYAAPVIEHVKALAAQGVPVVAITDSPLSPLVPVATVSFELGEAEAQPFRSLMAPICLAQILAVTAGERIAAASAPRSKRRRAGS